MIINCLSFYPHFLCPPSCKGLLACDRVEISGMATLELKLMDRIFMKRNCISFPAGKMNGRSNFFLALAPPVKINELNAADLYSKKGFCWVFFFISAARRIQSLSIYTRYGLSRRHIISFTNCSTYYL